MIWSAYGSITVQLSLNTSRTASLAEMCRNSSQLTSAETWTGSLAQPLKLISGSKRASSTLGLRPGDGGGRLSTVRIDDFLQLRLQRPEALVGVAKLKEQEDRGGAGDCTQQPRDGIPSDHRSRTLATLNRSDSSSIAAMPL